MQSKLCLMLAGTVLSAMLLGACNRNVNDDNNIAPKNVNYPINNRNVDNDLDRNNIMDRDNDLDRNNIIDRDNDLNDNHYSPAEDKNTDTDKDMFKDRNTKQEDIIEDDIDRNDRDNKDE